MEEEKLSYILENMKIYGKIDYEEDQILIMLIQAAVETLKHAGIPEDTNGSLYDLAVMRLALHYYENREEVGTSDKTMPMGINWMIEQIRNNMIE